MSANTNEQPMTVSTVNPEGYANTKPRAFLVLKVAHAETPASGGLTAKAAFDTLSAFAERIGAPFPVEYRDAVLRAASVSSVKQRGGTRTGRISLAEAWKEAIRHSEAGDGKDEEMRAGQRQFNIVARLHAAFGNAEEIA